jgi:hypothetical protein
MSIDTTIEYQIALEQGDEQTAVLAAIVNGVSSLFDDDEEELELLVEEPDF